MVETTRPPETFGTQYANFSGVSKVEAGTVRDMLPPGGRRDRCVMAGRVVGRAARDGWRAVGGGRRVAGEGWGGGWRACFRGGGQVGGGQGVREEGGRCRSLERCPVAGRRPSGHGVWMGGILRGAGVPGWGGGGGARVSGGGGRGGVAAGRRRGRAPAAP